MGLISLRTHAERRRAAEIIIIGVVAVMLVGLSRLETRLFDLSETLAKKQDLFTTVIYFGLINFNVILILVLGFLLFRNVTKLVVERRRGVFGSNLRAKLVAALMFFALAPTLLFFYVSARFIVTSFDEWFSDKVRATIHETRDASEKIYRQDQRRLESLARVAVGRLHPVAEAGSWSKGQPLLWPGHALDGFDSLYGLDAVKIYDRSGRLVWSSRGPDRPRGNAPALAESRDEFVTEVLERFARESGMLSASTVTGEDQHDVVKGMAPILAPDGHVLQGAVLTETHFETQILRSIEAILRSFSNLRPGAQLIKLSYLILLIVMTLLVGFAAVWLGFYVARAITGPIQALAEGTKEVALGNYGITLTPRSDDETGQLVKAFNQMTKDLRRHRSEADDARLKLLASYEELERRRKYMEVILRNILAGVVAVDRDGLVTTVNSAAAQLLGIEAGAAVGRPIAAGLGPELYGTLWRPIAEGLETHDVFSATLEVSPPGSDKAAILLAQATRIEDENGEDLGTVLVFDDATEQVKAQRVAAWREVARRIAHEIKNPVTPIKLNAQRLLRRFHGRFDGEEQEVFESCLESILKQVDSLRDLVNEFSKFSRLPQVKPRIGSIAEVITDVANLYRMSYPHVEIDTTGLQPLPEFPLDKDQMNRVFVNLVNNAIAALGDGEGVKGRIEISGAFIPELMTVRVEISDNGTGIPAHLRERVLEPYFSTRDGGTGLGLAIVHQIITDHGGYLRLLANEPRGTRVVIELPTGGRGPQAASGARG